MSAASVPVPGGAPASAAGRVGRPGAGTASGRGGGGDGPGCAVHAGGAVVHTSCTRREHGRGDIRRAWRDRARIAVGGGPWRGADAWPGRAGEAVR